LSSHGLLCSVLVSSAESSRLFAIARARRMGYDLPR
jgi:hypothetical protein